MKLFRWTLPTLLFIATCPTFAQNVANESVPPTQALAPVFNNTGRDACTQAVVVPVPAGPVGSPATVTILGNNSTATGLECVGGTNNNIAWWEAFQITQRARVTIDMCGTNPVQIPSYSLIQGGCVPSFCFSPITSNSSGRGAPYCGDGNEWYTFDALNPGIYKVPIFSDPSVLQNPRGPYVMHIQAEACPGSCCDFNSQTCIDCADPASCTGPGQAFNAGENCFRARCFQPPGPDVIVGNVWDCLDLGRVGPIGSGTVAMSCNTTACNAGNATGNWIGLPSTDHPMIMVNMYRESTVAGASRFEQIGQGWLKHGFGSSNANECGFGCENPGNFEKIGVGCSDTYDACQFDPCGLGPRSMLNPYTGAMPGGAALATISGCGPCANDNHSYPANDHRDHVHTPISHKVQIQEADLNPIANAGARYFAEGQYIAPHEFTSGNGNQNNNATHVEVAIGGPDVNGVYTYTSIAAAEPESPAVDAWTGSSKSKIEPAPLADGIAYVAWQATDLGGGQWHYEYALYNQNMDRAMGSFCVPLASGVNVSNVGFHAPLNQAPEPHTETYSNDPWTPTVAAGAIRWDTETFAQNPEANSVRFGTLYNFRFDADAPPQAVNSAVGLFKTDELKAAAAFGPSAASYDDLDGNGIADVCDAGGPVVLRADISGIAKNRYLAFQIPPPAATGMNTALQVKLVSLMHPNPPNPPQFPPTNFSALENQVRWVGPVSDCVESAISSTTFKCAQLQCTPTYADWGTALNGAMLYVSGAEVVPSSSYDIKVFGSSCQGNENACSSVSVALTVNTARWGDVTAPFQAPSPAPITQPNIADVSAIVDKFKDLGTAPIIAIADLNPGTPDSKIFISDVASCVDSFKGLAYTFPVPSGCP
ncbi:MAG: hypothetical protein HY287_11600 [Planctomycetes bacterium]|nr:hypothetical protein [Planctomycetota bacterium]